MNHKIKRICRACNRKKPLAAFYKDATNKSGVSGVCKLCKDEQLKAKRASFLGVVIEQKKCAKCKMVKAREEFTLNRSAGTGLNSYCRKCQNTIAKRGSLRKVYGISLEQKAAFFWLQEGRCSICNRPFGPPINRNIDHDHKTDKIRGLLCSSCNLGLGMLHDNGHYLMAAIRYINASDSNES